MWIAHVEINVFSQMSQCPVVLWQGENVEARLRLGPHRCTAHIHHLNFNLRTWKNDVASCTKANKSAQQLVFFALDITGEPS